MAAGCRPEAREHLVWTVWWYRKESVRSPIFRSQSPCTYIYVQESQRFGNFVRIYTYESRKGLRVNLCVKNCGKIRNFLIFTAKCAVFWCVMMFVATIAAQNKQKIGKNDIQCSRDYQKHLGQEMVKPVNFYGYPSPLKVWGHIFINFSTDFRLEILTVFIRSHF